MHDNGLYHGDLNLKNIIVDSANPKLVYIIDWDKSRCSERLTNSEKRVNVLRFCRSMAKFSKYGLPFTEDDQFFFLEVYWGDRKKAQKDLFRLKLTLAARRSIWAISTGRQSKE